MGNLTVVDITAWLLALFFVIGAIGNWRLPPTFREGYLRWGLPAGFNYVTAVLEFAAAMLLVFGQGRLLGAGLGLLVMAGATAILVRHKEFKHALAPLLVSAVCMAVILMSL